MVDIGKLRTEVETVYKSIGGQQAAAEAKMVADAMKKVAQGGPDLEKSLKTVQEAVTKATKNAPEAAKRLEAIYGTAQANRAREVMRIARGIMPEAVVGMAQERFRTITRSDDSIKKLENLRDIQMRAAKAAKDHEEILRMALSPTLNRTNKGFAENELSLAKSAKSMFEYRKIVRQAGEEIARLNQIQSTLTNNTKKTATATTSRLSESGAARDERLAAERREAAGRRATGRAVDPEVAAINRITDAAKKQILPITQLQNEVRTATEVFKGLATQSDRIAQSKGFSESLVNARTRLREFRSETVSTIAAMQAQGRSLAEIVAFQNVRAGAENRLSQAIRGGEGALKSHNRELGRVAVAHRTFKDFSRDFQSYAGSIARSVGLLTGLSVGLFARSIFESGREMVKLEATLRSAFGSEVSGEMEYLRSVSDRLGASFADLGVPYARLQIAAKSTNLSMQQTRDIFESITTASVALGLNTEGVRGTVRAFEQIISKGRVQYEELRLQLGDRLPGAVTLFARAWLEATGRVKSADGVKVSTSQMQAFDKAMQNGLVTAETVLPIVARLMRTEMADAARRMQTGIVGAIARIRNAFFVFAKDLFDAGLEKSLVGIFDAISRALADKALINGIASLSNTFATFVQVVVDNYRILFGVLSALGSTIIIGGILKLGSSLVTMYTTLSRVGNAILGIRGVETVLGSLVRYVPLLARIGLGPIVGSLLLIPPALAGIASALAFTSSNTDDANRKTEIITETYGQLDLELKKLEQDFMLKNKAEEAGISIIEENNRKYQEQIQKMRDEEGVLQVLIKRWSDYNRARQLSQGPRFFDVPGVGGLGEGEGLFEVPGAEFQRFLSNEEEKLEKMVLLLRKHELDLFKGPKIEPGSTIGESAFFDKLKEAQTKPLYRFEDLKVEEEILKVRQQLNAVGEDTLDQKRQVIRYLLDENNQKLASFEVDSKQVIMLQTLLGFYDKLAAAQASVRFQNEMTSRSLKLIELDLNALSGAALKAADVGLGEFNKTYQKLINEDPKKRNLSIPQITQLANVDRAIDVFKGLYKQVEDVNKAIIDMKDEGLSPAQKEFNNFNRMAEMMGAFIEAGKLRLGDLQKGTEDYRVALELLNKAEAANLSLLAAKPDFIKKANQAAIDAEQDIYDDINRSQRERGALITVDPFDDKQARILREYETKYEETYKKLRNQRKIITENGVSRIETDDEFERRRRAISLAAAEEAKLYEHTKIISEEARERAREWLSLWEGAEARFSDIVTDMIFSWDSGTEDIKKKVLDMSKFILSEITKLAIIKPILSSIFGEGGFSVFATKLFTGGAGVGSGYTPQAFGSDPFSTILGAKGLVFNQGVIQRYAKGEVFTSPQMFPLRTGATGVIAEEGAEAAMPLIRTRSGHLGVRTVNEKREPDVKVELTINTDSDGAQHIFRSRGQLEATIAGAVARARRIR